MDSNFPKFEAATALQDELKKANEAYIELFLTACRTSANDPVAAALLGFSCDTLLEYSNSSRGNLLSASRFGAPLFIPRITDPSQLRQIFGRGFSEERFLQCLVTTHKLPIAEKLSVEVSASLQEALKKANASFIELLLTASKASSTDSVAALLLGISFETLAEYSTLSRENLFCAARLGFPLFQPRITDQSLLHQVLTTGFSGANVIASLTKNLELPSLGNF